jgi:hypothetical protein
VVVDAKQENTVRDNEYEPLHSFGSFFVFCLFFVAGGGLKCVEVERRPEFRQ